MPPLARLPPDAARRAEGLFSDLCAVHAARADAGAAPELLGWSRANVSLDLAEVGAKMRRAKETGRIGKQLGHIVVGREQFGLGEVSDGAQRHRDVWAAQPKLGREWPP